MNGPTSPPVVGAPHSMQRYLIFGTFAGLIAGMLILTLDLEQTLTTSIAAAIAALAAGYNPLKVEDVSKN
jgi:uncharacterized membrane protein YccC